MNKYAAKLDGAVSQLFIIGFAASKFRSIPIVLVSLILTLISLIAYLLGYFLWFIATLLYPDHPRKQEFWYGFAQFKQQYQLASLLGAIACIMCLLCPPLFLVPALWIFAISNMLWSIAEYHKLQHPPTDNPNYSTKQQTLYLRYVILMTAVCVLSAICATMAIFCPQLAFLAFILPMTVGNLLTLAAFHCCGQCILTDFKPDHSYAKLSRQLSFDLAHQSAPGEQPVLQDHYSKRKTRPYRHAQYQKQTNEPDIHVKLSY